MACPEFRRDLESRYDFDGPERITEEAFDKKWPRAKEILQAEANNSDAFRQEALDFYKLLALEQIVVDPWLVSKDQIKRGLWDDPIPLSFFASHDKPDPAAEQKRAEEHHRRAGEELFRRAAIVIPIYPETNKDDINWQLVEKLKQKFYGHTYRPKPKLYDKIIKTFAMGELLRDRKGFSSWQEIANAVELSDATVRYIYDRAFQLVYGVTPDKRPYRTQEEITFTERVEDIPDNPGPSLKEKLIGEDVEKFSSAFEDREECHQCLSHVDSSAGRYSPDPQRPYNELFTCNACLVLSK